MAENYMTIDYKETMEKKYRARVQRLLALMPPYCEGFQKFANAQCTLHTSVQYLNDVYTFFRFLADTNPMIKAVGIRCIDLGQLERLTGDDFDEYLLWLKAYRFDPDDLSEKEKRNSDSTKRRKMVSLSMFFKYLYKRKKIDVNPAEQATRPKAKKQLTCNIRILNDDELKYFLEAFDDAYEAAQDAIFSATELDLKKDSYLKMRPAMILRDKTIVHLILNTGLRVAELCAINCADIAWKTGKINVIRKEDPDDGKKQNYVCINEAMMSLLNEYIEDARPLLSPNEYYHDALFVGNKRTRITPRSVERMVAKYAAEAIGENNGITPHKLRATFGSRYYRRTSDLTATAYALNHTSGINVAAKYYLRPADDALEQAATLNLVPGDEV